jgi:hypothetical protein
MRTTEAAATDRFRAYRRRKLANGRRQFIADLTCEDLDFIDQLKEQQGLNNRGQVLEQLIAIGREIAQQQLT